MTDRIVVDDHAPPSPPMRVLLVNAFYHPNLVGGAEHSVRILAESLRRLGCQVAVFTYDGGSSGIEHERVGGVPIYRASARWFGPDIFGEAGKARKAWAIIRSQHNAAAARSFARVMHEFQPDVVHTNGLYGMSPQVWIEARRARVPVIHTLRDYALLDPQSVVGSSPAWIARLHCRRMRRLAARYLDAVTAPSWRTLAIHEEADFFADVIRDRIVNCVELDLPRTEALSRMKSARTSLDPVRFVFAGNLAPYKGLPRLIEAFSRVRSSSITLTICGRGRIDSETRDRADRDPRIEFLGHQSKPELERVFADCDVLVAPSVWEEPFGRVVIEAFASAMPVIGSDRGGIAEILAESGGGRVFRGDDPAELSAAIGEFAERSTVVNYMEKAVRFVENYGEIRQAEAFLGLYRRTKVASCVAQEIRPDV